MCFFRIFLRGVFGSWRSRYFWFFRKKGFGWCQKMFLSFVAEFSIRAGLSTVGVDFPGALGCRSIDMLFDVEAQNFGNSRILSL